MTHDVVVTRIFDAPVERVWRAWVEPEMVKGWWGPEGFTCPLARMDFRVGGASLVCMRAPKEFGGQDFYNTWTYETIEPMQRFVYISRHTDKEGRATDPAVLGLPPGLPKEVRNVNTFKATGRSTELTVVESTFPSKELAAMSKSGLEQCLDKIAKLLG
jgi:uncharacterized protein YndB with AHSA1/START domain